MKKNILLFMVTFTVSTFLLATNNVSSLQGSGTDLDPFKIGTVEELVFFRTQVNDSVPSYMTASYELTSAFDLQNESWVAIGNVINRPFKGKFNGKGNKLTNLKIGSSTTKANVAYASLFGAIENASISNLKMEGVALYNSPLAGSSFNSLIISQAKMSTITNCHATGSIDSEGNLAACFAGGIASQMTGSTIINCSANVDIKLRGTTEAAQIACGGIAGQLIYNVVDGTEYYCNVYNSYSTGSINTASPTSTFMYGGGIGGNQNRAHIANCYSSVSIVGICNGSTAGKSFVGGISGANAQASSLSYCIALNNNLKSCSTGAATTTRYVGRVSGNKAATASLSDNYAKTMDIKLGADEASATVYNAVAGAATKDGVDLGVNIATDLLNGFVTNIVSYAGVNFKSWEVKEGVNNGNPIFKEIASAVNNIDAATTMRAYTSNGVVTVLNIEAGSVIAIYGISGALISQKTVAGNRLDIALPKGVYFVKGIRNLIVNQ